ncbi:MAG: hypothetical protein HYT13_00675 [Candidatus Liptonbacteria bacterium]|nr:hypothetical protein [Candidatus Liptonbacteria bacterium]
MEKKEAVTLKREIFKAYDIRGLYPKDLNEKAVFEIVRNSAEKLFGKGGVVVGHDARLSSPKLYKAVLQGLKAGVPKAKLFRAGLITTPMLYFLVNQFGARGGLMVTASHNPKEYNGLKIVGEQASPISGNAIFKLIH